MMKATKEQDSTCLKDDGLNTEIPDQRKEQPAATTSDKNQETAALTQLDRQEMPLTQLESSECRPGAVAVAGISANSNRGSEEASGFLSVDSMEFRQNFPSDPDISNPRRSLRFSQTGMVVEATLVAASLDDVDEEGSQNDLDETGISHTGVSSSRHERTLRRGMSNSSHVESHGIIVNARRVYDGNEKSRRSSDEWQRLAWIAPLLVILLVVVVALAIVLPNSNDSPSVTLDSLTLPPTVQEIEFWEDILSASTKSSIFSTTQTTPQSQAYDWVESVPLFSDYSAYRKAQLFGLAALYFALDGDNWSNNDDWLNPEVAECRWFSTDDVRTCNLGREYFSLSLSQNGLNGTVPEELFLMTSLATLDLSRNNISGLAGYGEYKNLADFYEIDLSYNDLAGPIIAYIALLNLPSLTAVNMRFNRISGHVPVFLNPGAFLAWEDLDISNNLITGQIPELFGEFRRVDVSNNLLTGALPSGATSGAKPKEIRVSSNMLSGELPKSMGELTQLQVYDLSHNLLTGAIPKEFANMRKMEDFNLASNHFNGDISVVSNWEKIQTLDLSNNTFTGSLPNALGQLTDLISFLVNDNQLNGTIPVTVGNMTAARFVHLDDNLLSGSLPTELGELSNLQELDVHGNLLTGTIPSTLGLLSGLSTLALEGNKFWGAVPQEVCNLKVDGKLSLLRVDCSAVDCNCDCSCG